MPRCHLGALLYPSIIQIQILLVPGTSAEYLVGTTGVLFLFHMSYIGTWPVGSLLRMKRIYHSSIDSLHRMILLDWCIADWYLRC